MLEKRNGHLLPSRFCAFTSEFCIHVVNDHIDNPNDWSVNKLLEIIDAEYMLADDWHYRVSIYNH